MDEEKRRQEEKERHEKTKRTLKIVGVVLLVCGIILFVAFFIDFMLTIYETRGMPKLFVCGMIGLPMIAFGAMCLQLGNRREIGNYMKNEMTPVINDAAYDLKPAVKAVAEAVKETEEQPKAEEKKVTICPNCGKENQPENKFCDGCGTPLYKICPACGAKQEADDSFCGNCGAKL